MARQPIVPPGQRTVTQYHDADGNLVVETEYHERIIISPDGSVTNLKQADNIQLASGEMFNPAMAAGQNPVLTPGLCRFCQRRRRPSMVNAKHLRLCVGCGRPCCPVHRRQSRYDKQPRCRRCHRCHRMGLAVRAVFMERVE